MRMDALAGCPVSHVAVVAAYDVVYTGISTWLNDDQTLHGATAGHYPDAQQFLRDHPTHRNRSEVVLLVLNADAAPHFAAVRELSSHGHRVVVYSHLTDRDVIRTVMDSGALTCLAKSEGRQHLLDAIKAAVTETPYVGPLMAAAMRGDDVVQRPALAPREQQVLVAWFRTDSKELVAQQLFLAPSTVRTHLQRIRAKYAAVGRPAGTKAALVARAIQDRIIGIDDL
ncbi:MAG: LuxR C-terminal-related transcriptional regulator [Mycobacterium sp.]|nr:LuxR C-terminal-related transcriptional regulator [Mycobacterium sp.]